jgi:hypothetical protein
VYSQKSRCVQFMVDILALEDTDRATVDKRASGASGAWSIDPGAMKTLTEIVALAAEGACLTATTTDDRWG